MAAFFQKNEKPGFKYPCPIALLFELCFLHQNYFYGKSLESSQPALSPIPSGAVPSIQDGFSYLEPTVLPEIICILWLKSLHIWGLV